MTSREAIAAAWDLLRKVSNICLATVCSDGRPWTVPVYAAFDKHLSFFWSSLRDALHSRNLRRTGRVMLLVFDSTEPDRNGGALYIEGSAEEVANTSGIRAGLECLAHRKQENPLPVGDFVQPAPQRIYRAIIRAVWTNHLDEDAGRQIDTPVPIVLDALKQHR